MSTPWPKISIVTPSFNQGQYIEQTIDSVLSQGYPNLEYFIFDGGSTDETVEILKKYSNHLTYWESVKDRGQSHAINKGIERSSGEIFNWINSDDFAEPGALKHVAEVWMQQQEPPAAICGYANVWNDKEFSHRRKPSFIGQNSEDSVVFFNINQEGTYFNLSEVKALGGLDERFHFAMDLELWICLNLKFSSQRFVVSDSTLGNFRRHLETKSAYQNRQTLEDSDIIHEELLIFDAFFRVANPNNLSFALSLGLPEPFKYNLRQVEIQDLNTDQMRKDYCIKWGKKLLDLKRSTQIISVLKNLPKNLDWNAKREVFYLRRKAYFPFL
jgi:glycosyltransferase involved in cell wall biosynthesis